MEDPQDRREFPRVAMAVRVRIEHTGIGFSATTRNLSAGGIFLETTQRLPVGTRLNLQIALPLITQAPIRVEGEVVWQSDEEPRGIAVRYTKISDEDRELFVELAEKFSLP